MDVAVKKVPVNFFKIWVVAAFGCFILWLIPLILGKYTDVTFPYVDRNDIVQELVGLVGGTSKGMQWCPHISPNIEDGTHLIEPDFETKPEKEVMQKYGITQGGSWKPHDCQSRYKVRLSGGAVLHY